MSSEPRHQELWELWQKASRDYESCSCERCTGERMTPDCEKWAVYERIKRRYVREKEEAL